MTDEQNWIRDENGIFRVTHPKDVTVLNILKTTTEVIYDYLKNKDRFPQFLVLVDGSKVESYSMAAFNISTGKVQNHVNGRVAVYNISPNYKIAIEEFKKSHKISDNIQYFEDEASAKNWLISNIN